MEEELYYPSSENKGADQLRGYREADLRLCFRHLQIVGFPMWWLILQVVSDSSSLTNEKDHHYFLNSADVCW